MYDAIGKTMNALDKKLDEFKKTARVLFVVLTDGQENASQEFKKTTISKMIKAKEKSGWSVAYMGASKESWDDAASIGIAAGNTLQYNTRNIKASFMSLSNASGNYIGSNISHTCDLFDGSAADDSIKTKKTKKK